MLMNTVKNREQAFGQNLPDLEFRYQRLFETFKSEIYFPERETGKDADGNPNRVLTFSRLNETPLQDPAIPAALQPTTCVDSLFLFHLDANHKKKREEMTLSGIKLLPVITNAPGHEFPSRERVANFPRKLTSNPLQT